MSTRKLVQYMQWGLLLILAIMPFHAFLSVWFGSMFGHQAIFQAWKEVVILVLAVATLGLAIKDQRIRTRLRQAWILAIFSLVILGLVVTAITRPLPLVAAFGIKTDFEYLIAAIIAACVADKLFLMRALKIIVVAAAIVSGYDVLQIFLLPPDFLTHFGYGPSTIAPFQHIAEGTSALRFPATLGGPNQLGTYLILPICLSAALYIKQRRPWQAALFVACLISLTWTFSRSAWLGAGVALIVTILATIPKHSRRPALLVSAAAVAAGLIALPLLLSSNSHLQFFILHSSIQNHDQANLSDSQHAASLTSGASSLLNNPLGHGLGTAGPATFHEGAINIIENFYLQIGYEMGVLAIVIFGFIVVTLIIKLIKKSQLSLLAIPAAAALIGISLVALVLPAWVDSSTSLILWIVAGALVAPNSETAHV